MIETKILSDPLEAADILRRGGIVAVPTETVYGLAARFDDPQAVDRVFLAKGRPADNPLIVHCAGQTWLARICDAVTPDAQALLDRFAPGPITVTVQRNGAVSDRVSGGLPSVAARIPSEPLMVAVLNQLGIPVVAPSANRSGRPSPTTWEAVHEELYGRIDAILMGPPCGIGIESTVVDCCHSPPVLLRPGSISFEALSEVLPELVLLDPVGPLAESSPKTGLASPGLRHRHYSPTTKVVLVDRCDEMSFEPGGDLRCGYLGLDAVKNAEQFIFCRTFATAEEYARWLFASFRQADQMGLTTLYCQRVELEGIGRGLMDRIERAAKG